MCLYVFVSRGCFRHRSALANGFFVASISILSLRSFLSLSLWCALLFSRLALSHKLQQLCFAMISLSCLLLPLKVFLISREKITARLSFEAKIWGKIIFQKSPLKLRWLFSSVVYTLTNTRNKIRFASFDCPTHSCALSLSLTLSWLRAWVCLCWGTHQNALETKSNLFPVYSIRFV